jgi:hypothetical protein
MANSNNDVRELEDLLTELEGQGALPVGPYSDEDDAVTQLMDTPLGDQEWMIQITPLDRRMMSTEQLLAELATGTLVKRDMLVWRTGMSDWAPIHRMDELAGSGVIDVPVVPERGQVPERRPVAERRPAPLPPPPAPIPPRLAPTPLGSSTLASPGALPPPPSLASSRVPAPSTPFGAPRPLTPVPDVPPVAPLPLLNSAFGSSSVTPVVPQVAPLPELGSAFNVPPPAAPPSGMALQPPPPPATMRTTTQRPVAVDFSEIEPARPAPIRVLIGSGVAALAMIVGTVYALSAGGVFESGAETSHVAPEPAAAASSAAAAAPKAAEAKVAERQPAADKPMAEPGRASDEPQTQPVSAKEELVAPEPALRAASKAAASQELAAKEEAPQADVKDEAKSKAAASADDEQEEASMPAKTRAERRLSRRQKRTSTEEERAAAAPRRTKARATPAATAPRAPAPAAEAEAAPKATASDPPGSTFNRQAAKTALDDAAAQARNCRPQGGPSGSGKVQVRYEPNGKVGGVSLLTPMFDNTTTGDCVVMVFRRASVPAFTGSPPVVMNKSFEIP